MFCFSENELPGLNFPGIFSNTGAARGHGSSTIGSLDVASHYIYVYIYTNLNFDGRGMNLFDYYKNAYAQISWND